MQNRPGDHRESLIAANRRIPGARPIGCWLGFFGSLMGVLVGLFLSAWSFRIQAEKMRAADPKAFICGNAGIPGMLVGVMVGGVGGLLIAGVLSQFSNRAGMSGNAGESKQDETGGARYR